MTSPSNNQIEEIRELIENGKAKQAEALIRDLLESDPANISLKRLLAVSFYHQNLLDQAETLFENILIQTEFDPVCTLDYAIILRQETKLDRAKEVLEKTLSANERLSPGRFLLADIFFELGDYDNAREQYLITEKKDPFQFQISETKRSETLRDPERMKRIYSHILQQDDQHVIALCGLAMIAIAEANYFAAYRYFTTARQVTRYWPTLLLGLARLNSLTGRYAESLEPVKNALKINPGNPSAWNLFGYLHRELGFSNEAISCFKNSLTLDPNQAGTKMMLARCYMLLGEPNQAHQLYLSCFEDHGEVTAIWNLTRVPLFELTVGQRLLLEGELDKTPRVNDEKAMNIRSSLGAWANKSGSYGRAFDLWLGSFQRSSYSSGSYSEEFSELVNHICSITERGYLRPNDNIDPREISVPPIIFVGLPGSGFGIVTEVLASLPGIGKPFNVPFFSFLAQDAENRLSKASSFYASSKDWNGTSLNSVRDQYLEISGQFAQFSQRPIDTSSDNFLYLGLILKLFPNARIIDFRRSFWDQFIASLAMPSNMTLSLLGNAHELYDYLHNYHRLMKHWHSLNPDAVLRLTLEEWHSDKKIALEAISEHCDLGLTKEQSLAILQKLPSDNSCFVHPIYESTESIGRAQHYTAFIEDTMGIKTSVW